MALFNHATKEVTAKLVYYGPGLCGKTTNLQWIHDNLSFASKGKLVSLATQTDRTLFFDFLPVELGTIRGMRTRMQIYTVPGQVFYEATRRMVLKGCDAVVFVADSQAAMLDANFESLQSLRRNLLANEIDPAIPMVIQYNKRDLPTALPVSVLNQRLNPKNVQHFESVAFKGTGVEETLRGITKALFRWLSEYYAESGRQARPSSGAATPAPTPAPPKAEGGRITVRVPEPPQPPQPPAVTPAPGPAARPAPPRTATTPPTPPRATRPEAATPAPSAPPARQARPATTPPQPPRPSTTPPVPRPGPSTPARPPEARPRPADSAPSRTAPPGTTPRARPTPTPSPTATPPQQRPPASPTPAATPTPAPKPQAPTPPTPKVSKPPAPAATPTPAPKPQAPTRPTPRVSAAPAPTPAPTPQAPPKRPEAAVFGESAEPESPEVSPEALGIEAVSEETAAPGADEDLPQTIRISRPTSGPPAAPAPRAPAAPGPPKTAPEDPPPQGAGLSEDQWLYLLEGSQRGPIDVEDLVDLVLTSIPEDTKVWHPGLEGWVQAREVNEIAQEIPPPLPIPGATRGAAVEEEMPDFDTVPPQFRTALIADEDEAFRKYLAMPLAAQGFTILEAADGSAAWQLAVQHRPWLILADVTMPELDGFEFCRRVRSHALLSHTPLLFISGSDKYKERYHALQIGADDFLTKQTKIREILMRIQLLLTKYSDLSDQGEEKKRGGEREGAFEGRIEVFGAPALLQMCAQGRLTGLFTALAEDEADTAATMGFRSGEIVSATVGSDSGLEAAYSFLGWEKGSFQFAPGDPGEGEPLAQSVEHLLLEGCRLLDESERDAGGAASPF
jgi:CheY-like chemotaxis protein/signal recognition particle receptor subunit beta